MKQSTNLHIVDVNVDDLKPSPHNARIHDDKKITQLAAIISELGFNVPVLASRDNILVCGHARVLAAKKLGIKEVPVIYIDHLSPAKIRAFRIADNKIAEKAQWDKELLKIEFEYLLVNLDCDIELTAFDTPEIDLVLRDESSQETNVESPIPQIEEKAVSRLDDLWLLDKHRIYCGNALNAASYTILLGEEKADLVFTDPPYNVPIQGHVSGLGKVIHSEFAMASGEMTDEEFITFLLMVFQLMIAFSRDGSIHYCCMDWRHIGEVLAAATGQYSEVKNICVWNKDNGGMGSLYRSKHEFVVVFKNGTAPHVNNIELGKHGRNRTNVWNYPGQNSFKARNDKMLSQHPTPKPVAMVADAIRDCSKLKSIVLDPFAGSGSTLIAAELTGRYARVMELEPRYVDVIIRRWQDYTGRKAVLAETGASFAEVKRMRSASPNPDAATMPETPPSPSNLSSEDNSHI